jgi:hypothetical protein
MKTTVLLLHYHKLVLKIDNNTKAISEAIIRNSVEILLMQYKDMK